MMNETNKKVLFGFGVLGSIFVGIILLIFLFSSIGASSSDSHFEGNATAEKTAKFNKYYDDFDRITNFLLVECKESMENSEAESGLTYDIEVDEGNIMGLSTEGSSLGESYWKPFKINKSIRSSIKELKAYFEVDEELRVNLLNGQVRFMYHSERVIYSPDDSVPVYRYHPRELASSYSVWKLRDNWYLAENTTPYPGT